MPNQNTYKTMCIRGHLLNTFTVYPYKGHRLCKKCCAIRARKNRRLHYDATIEHYYRNREEILKKRKLANIEKRIKIISHYSNGTMCCKLCGLKGFEFLTIDHINGGGTKEREKLGSGGETFFNWLIKNKFPKGLQILCYNCNCVKGTHGLERLLSLLKEQGLSYDTNEMEKNQ